MKKLEHLLILTPGFPNDEQETECLPAVQQFIHCYRRQFPAVRISVLSLHYPFNKQHYRWHGLNIVSIRGKNKTGIKRFPVIWRAMRTGLQINRKNKVDAVLSLWLTDAAFVGKLITKRLKVPHLIWMHGQDAKPGNKYLKIIKPQTHELAAISSFQNEILYKSYGFRAGYIINNGINEAVFPELNIGKRDIDIIAVGSLIPLKQFHLFIEVLKYLKENGQEQVRAMLIGDGILDTELEELISSYMLNDNIQMVHKAKHAQVLEAMNQAKILVHPSSYEGHSTVMLEALYSGCKVVSFIPLGEREIEEQILCNNLDEMNNACLQFLAQPMVPNRVKYSDMNDSVACVHDIFNAMIDDTPRADEK